jgi:transposase-like protein
MALQQESMKSSELVILDEATKQRLLDMVPKSGPGRRRYAAMKLVAGESVVAVARELGIPARTIYSWLANREYREYIDNLRTAIVAEAVGRLVDASTRAAETLVRLLDDPDSGIRLRASTSLIETMVRLREHMEFDRRIRVLEERYGHAIEAGGFDGDEDDGLPAAPDGAADAGPAEEEME